MPRSICRRLVCLVVGVGVVGLNAAATVVNFETPHVNPIAMSPDGDTVAVCNTPDDRIEIFDVTGIAPVLTMSIAVGVDPVSVRFRTDTEVWVANQVSDSVSVVDLNVGAVARTLMVVHDADDDLYLDEPADIAFAGSPQRAFVTFSQSNRVAVFNPNNLDQAATVLEITGEDPRALAVSPDGNYVYAAVYESGNRTTVLGGGAADLGTIPFPPNVVSDPTGPYGGINPAPNDGSAFLPPIEDGAVASQIIPVGLIVKQGTDGKWRDDNGVDWTDMVSGPNAAKSGRPVGWHLLDHDLARINANTLVIDYATSLMNICMNLAVNPTDGRILVVGTDGTNEVRFEPVINGKFLRVNGAFVDPTSLIGSVFDLNPHLGDYSDRNIEPAERAKSIGDPRGIAWNAAGDRCYVAGMGSNNLIVLDENGDRVGAIPTELPEGPTGVVVDDARGRLYVVSKFAATLSQISLDAKGLDPTVALHDPTPEPIKVGRKHLYDTHKNSGLGHISCGSCHVDARMDRLAWDLGDPSGRIKPLNDDEDPQNLGANIPGLEIGQTSPAFRDWHPMKGPMSTQTMQDIIGHEPFHWRGDRDGLEEFNGAFTGLQAADSMLTPTEMQEFEDFLATVHYPPNPFRNVDNSLPRDLDVGALGQRSVGRFKNQGGLDAGDPHPAGDAVRALANYRDFENPLDNDNFACVLCHTLPTGIGTNSRLNGFMFEPLPPGQDGEARHSLVSVDGSTNKAIKTANLRNIYEKTGCEFTTLDSMAGSGFLHDGSADSITRFVSSTVFEMESDQEIADMVALMLAFSGSQFPGTNNPLEPPGTASKDAHAAVGRQMTITSLSTLLQDAAIADLLTALVEEQSQGDIGLVVHQPDSMGVLRGYVRTQSKGAGSFIPDRADQSGVTLNSLLAVASTSRPLTLTAVPTESATRLGIDRDGDGLLDNDEVRDLDPLEPGIQNPFDPANPDVTGDDGSMEPDGIVDSLNDFDGDDVNNGTEFEAGTMVIPSTTLPNDVDRDGTVNSIDIQLVINRVLNVGGTGMDTDVNNDGKTDSVDIQLVILAVLGG